MKKRTLHLAMAFTALLGLTRPAHSGFMDSLAEGLAGLLGMGGPAPWEGFNRVEGTVRFRLGCNPPGPSNVNVPLSALGAVTLRCSTGGSAVAAADGSYTVFCGPMRSGVPFTVTVEVENVYRDEWRWDHFQTDWTNMTASFTSNVDGAHSRNFVMEDIGGYGRFDPPIRIFDVEAFAAGECARRGLPHSLCGPTVEKITRQRIREHLGQ